MGVEQSLFVVVYKLTVIFDIVSFTLKIGFTELRKQVYGWLSSMSLLIPEQSRMKPPVVVVIGTHADQVFFSHHAFLSHDSAAGD